MKRTLALIVVAGGCRGPAQPGIAAVVAGNRKSVTQATTQRRWQLWSVDTVSDRNLMFRWRGTFNPRYKGAKYMLYDQQNWRGSAQIVDEAVNNCDHCAGPLVDAVPLTGPGCADELFGNVHHDCYAVGPVTDAEIANAEYADSWWRDRRYRVISIPELSDKWTALLTVPLGPGATVNEVQRCGRWESSGCVADSVCSKVCTGIAVGDVESLHLQPAPDSITCQSYIPDLVDCLP